MTSLAFDYERPDNVDEAVTLLGSSGSVLLAGGQSLVPLLNRRAVTPRLVVDISRIAELRKIEWDENLLRIGAAVRLGELEKSEALAHFPLLAEAIASTASPAIRNRATLVGNLVRANAMSELSVVCVALDANVVIRGQSGLRSLPAAEFFLGHHSSAVGRGEMVLRLEIPRSKAIATGAAFSEIASRAGAPPLVCVAASIEADAMGIITAARIIAGGITGKPSRCAATEAALIGQSAATAAQRIVPENLVPAGELRDAGYALEVLPVVIARAVARASAQLPSSATEN